MKKEAKLFFINLIIISLLFILCSYSLVVAMLYEVKQEEILTKILEISYLFIHLIGLGLLFYLDFTIYKKGPLVIKDITLTDKEEINKKKLIVFSVLGTISLFIAIYSSLQVCGANLFLFEQIGFILWLDLMNAFYLLTLLFMTLIIYPLIAKKR